MKILYFLAHPDGIGDAATVIMTQAAIMQQNRNEVLVVLQNNNQNSHITEYDYLCNVIEKCKNNGFHVHITLLGANKNTYTDMCKEYVESHGLSNEVTFEGFDLDVEKYLGKSDLMIHASTCRSYPVVIIEAMGNRVPVIATPVAGVPELLEDCVNGFLAKGYYADDLYEAFEH